MSYETDRKTKAIIDALAEVLPAVHAFEQAALNAQARHGLTDQMKLERDGELKSSLDHLRGLLDRHFTEDHQIEPHRKGSKHAVTLSGLDMSAITAGMNEVTRAACFKMHGIDIDVEPLPPRAFGAGGSLELAAIPDHGKALTMDEFCLACFGLGDKEIDALCGLYHIRRSAYENYLPTWQAEAPARAQAFLTNTPLEQWLR